MTDAGDIHELVNDANLTLVAAWALPLDGPLSEAERKAALANFSAHLNTNKLTTADVAVQLGSPGVSTIRALLQGERGENADADIRTLNAWVEQYHRAKAATLGNGLVDTGVARAMMTVARLTRENATMGLAYGTCGIGKTRCAVAIHESIVGSIYLRVLQGRHTARELTRALADALGLRTGTLLPKHHHMTLLERILDQLKGSGRLLILDEADRLKHSALEVLRDIHDETNVPVLLVGTRDLFDLIQRSVDRDHGQLYSRFGIVMNIVEGKDVYTGGRPLFSVEDIRRLYEVVPIRLAKDAADYLRDVANQLGYGSLRRCRILVLNAARRARSRQALGEHEAVTISAADLEWTERALRQESGEQEAIDHRRSVTPTALAM